jgi:hypothetical protein
MEERRSVPLKGKRFLPQRVVAALLARAVDGEGVEPVCLQLATIHAAGAAVASFVVRAMRANILFLQDQVDVCRGELLHEEEFTLAKLREHVEIMSVLNTLVFCVTAERAAFRPSGGNLVSIALARLPSKLRSTFERDALAIREIMEDKIVWPMLKFLDEAETAEGRGHQKEIRELILTSCVHLREIYERLDTIAKVLVRIGENVKVDYQRDLDQVNEALRGAAST